MSRTSGTNPVPLFYEGQEVILKPLQNIRPLHNYIKSAIMSYRLRPVSSIIKHFLDSGFHLNDE